MDENQLLSTLEANIGALYENASRLTSERDALQQECATLRASAAQLDVLRAEAKAFRAAAQGADEALREGARATLLLRESQECQSELIKQLESAQNEARGLRAQISATAQEEVHTVQRVQNAVEAANAIATAQHALAMADMQAQLDALKSELAHALRELLDAKRALAEHETRIIAMATRQQKREASSPPAAAAPPAQRSTANVKKRFAVDKKTTLL